MELNWFSCVFISTDNSTAREADKHYNFFFSLLLFGQTCFNAVLDSRNSDGRFVRFAGCRKNVLSDLHTLVGRNLKRTHVNVSLYLSLPVYGQLKLSSFTGLLFFFFCIFICIFSFLAVTRCRTLTHTHSESDIRVRERSRSRTLIIFEIRTNWYIAAGMNESTQSHFVEWRAEEMTRWKILYVFKFVIFRFVRSFSLASSSPLNYNLNWKLFRQSQLLLRNGCLLIVFRLNYIIACVCVWPASIWLKHTKILINRSIFQWKFVNWFRARIRLHKIYMDEANSIRLPTLIRTCTCERIAQNYAELKIVATMTTGNATNH